VVTREVRHAPRDALAALDLRGGGQSADHVDLLGNEHVLEDIIALAAGKGGDLQDRWVSDARAIAARVVLPTDPPRQEGTV
jgi:phospholipid:diacylglycerol acyltransferase